MEDWSESNVALNFPIESRRALFTGMIYSGLMAIFISYATPWCIRTTTSTTYAMVGALNKIPIAVSGLVFFDAPVTLPSVSAIVIGAASGIVYAVAKIRQSEDSKKQAGLPTTAGGVSASSQSARDSFKN